MKRILSIDDELAILDCIQKALMTRGYEVSITTDPEEGLRRLREDDGLDLVTLDIKMPGKSGFDVYSEYRRFRKLPALFVTAYPKSFNMELDDVTEMWQKEFADGTTDILYKPFDLATLFEKVEGLIGAADKVDSEAPDETDQ